MPAIIYQVTDILNQEDTVRSIEQAAENIKQSIIDKYFELNSTGSPDENHDRIVLTAGVVIDD